jgi:hypothetical protein
MEGEISMKGMINLFRLVKKNQLFYIVWKPNILQIHINKTAKKVYF